MAKTFKDNSFEAKVKITFASHPGKDDFYFTSDGTAFYDLDLAKMHSKSLKVKTIQKITRAMAKDNKFAGAAEMEKELETANALAAQQKEVDESGNEFTDVTGKQKGEDAPKTEDGSQPTSDESTAGEKTEDGSPESEVVIPEGEPHKGWTVPQIKAWLDKEGVKYAHNSREEALLKKAKEVGSQPTSDESTADEKSEEEKTEDKAAEATAEKTEDKA